MQLLCSILHEVILPVIKRFVFKTRCYSILWHWWQQQERHMVCSPDVVCYPTCSINMCLQKWRLNHNLRDLSDCITFSCGKQQQKGKVFIRKKSASSRRLSRAGCRLKNDLCLALCMTFQNLITQMWIFNKNVKINLGTLLFLHVQHIIVTKKSCNT